MVSSQHTLGPPQEGDPAAGFGGLGTRREYNEQNRYRIAVSPPGTDTGGQVGVV